MQLVNLTPVPARLLLAPGEPFERYGLLAAKISFSFRGNDVVPEFERPLPVWDTDEETELGILPGDLVPPQSPGLEVIVLGRAHAPHGSVVTRMNISMRVADYHQTLVVHGDRSWADARPGRPGPAAQPFSSQPLTWERAFGGTARVHIDRGASIPVRHPLNARGRGFQPGPVATQIGKFLRVPDGYPVVEASDLLANIEHPEFAVSSRRDDPLPWCWATVPIDIGMIDSGAIAAVHNAQSLTSRDTTGDPAHAQRAHPSWRLPVPSSPPRIELAGCSADGPLGFRLPSLRVVADYVIGDRKGTVACRPYRLILLPEQRKLCLCVYKRFVISPMVWGDTSMRLRVEEGWGP